MFNNEQLLVKDFRFIIILLIGSLFINSCGPSRTIRIHELFESRYNYNFEYQVESEKKSPTGFTIGVLLPDYIEANYGANSWRITQPAEKQLLAQFKREISNSIEKILLNKGNTVAGPFESYEQMTFPQRDRCSFLIKPTFLLNLTLQRSIFQPLPDVGGPNLELYAYASGQSTVRGRIEMEYLILDPLTQQSLERHKIKTEEISINFTELAQGFYTDGKPGNFLLLNYFAEHHNPSLRGLYSNDYASFNVTAKIFERLFNSFIPELEKMLSVEEFIHLQKYQEQLRERKRF